MNYENVTHVKVICPGPERWIDIEKLKTWAQDAWFNEGSNGEIPLTVRNSVDYLGDLGLVTFRATPAGELAVKRDLFGQGRN